MSRQGNRFLKFLRLIFFESYIHFIKCINKKLNLLYLKCFSNFSRIAVNINSDEASSACSIKCCTTRKAHAGFSLLECMVAQTILLIALTVIFQFLSQVNTKLHFISQGMQAQLVLKDLSERIKLFDVSFEQVATLGSNNHQITGCDQNCSIYKNLANEIALWEQHLQTFNSVKWEMHTQELAAQKVVNIKLSWKGYKDIPQEKVFIHLARSKDDDT